MWILGKLENVTDTFRHGRTHFQKILGRLYALICGFTLSTCLTYLTDRVIRKQKTIENIRGFFFIEIISMEKIVNDDSNYSEP